MDEFVIDVGNVEALQMVNDTAALDKIFLQAKSTIIQGGQTILARLEKNGNVAPFDNISTEEDLESYKKGVYKFMPG